MLNTIWLFFTGDKGYERCQCKTRTNQERKIEVSVEMSQGIFWWMLTACI